MEPFGVLAYGEDSAAAGGGYKLSLSIHWTGDVYNLFLPIHWTGAETYNLQLPIEWLPDVYQLSLPIKWQVTAVYKLSLPIHWSYADVSGYPRATEDTKVYLSIDGVDYSSRLTGELRIRQSSGGSALADFSLLPDTGALDPMAWHGKLVEIDIAQWVSGVEAGRVRKYTGYVSNPEFDAGERAMHFSCTTDLQGVCENLSRADIDAITPGCIYSSDIFNDDADGWTYAQDRMRTRAASLWHDESRNIRLTDWAAKSTPDYTFTDADVYDTAPQLSRATRRDLLNRVRIALGYRFIRLRQRVRSVQWRSEILQCDFITKPISMITRDMVRQAVGSNGWVLQGDMVFDAVPPAGAYRCFPFASGSPIAKWIYWGTRFIGGVAVGQDDLLANYCNGAYFTLARRWAQRVDENYSFDVRADNSIEYSGEIGLDESYAMETEFDASEWETQTDYTGIAAGAVQNAAGDYVIDEVDRARLDLAQQVALTVAAVDMLGAHRKNSVTREIPFHPLVDLSHTVRFEFGYLTAQGVVEELEHVVNFDTGDVLTRVTLALSRHGGTGVVTNTALAPADVAEATEETAQSRVISLPYHIGGLSTSAPFDDSWTGAITNYLHDSEYTDPFGEDPANPQTVTYPKQFRIAMPAIEDAARNAVVAQGVKTVHVDIPQDELSIAA